MNYLGLLKKIKKLNETQPGFETVKFFRSDKASVWIWISILENHYSNKHENIEHIFRDIPTEYASRPTMFKIMNTALKKKYLFKERDKSDKRKFNIYPSNLTIREFENWSKKMLN